MQIFKYSEGLQASQRQLTHTTHAKKIIKIQKPTRLEKP